MSRMVNKIRRLVRLLLRRNKSLWRGIVNSVFAAFSLPFAPCLPIYVSIEPTAFCNLRCSICETGTKTIRRKQGVMGLDGYKRIIDRISFHTNSILLYFMGEPFLNPSIYEMLAYAKYKQIYTCICTNGENVDPERLIDSGIDEVSFQIGGVTQRTHSQYRCGADLDKCMENLRSLVRIKAAKNSRASIEAGFIVMKHNEHEVEQFKKMAQDIGVDRMHVIKPRFRTLAQAREFLPLDQKYWLYDKKSYEEGVLFPRKRLYRRCIWFWNSIVITWNGDIVPCCNDPHGQFVMGNIFREELKSIWGGAKYKALRKNMVRGKENLSLCKNCVE